MSPISTAASPPTTPTASARPLRIARSLVGAVACRGGLIQLGRRAGFSSRSGELLEPARRGEELVAVDVGVARDGREIGVAEVLGDEAGVADLFAEPGSRRVAQRMRGDVPFDPGALRGSPDDVGEDRLLQASTSETAEDRVGRRGLACVVELQQLMGEASWQRLTSRLAALPVLDEQRPLASVEVEIPPLERAEL